MLIVFKLLFKSSNESTAWHRIELIDHAYHALACGYNQKPPHAKSKHIISKFSLREHAPRLLSLTCLAHAVKRDNL